MRLLTPGKLVGAGLVLLAVLLAVLWLTPSGEYLVLPDTAEPVAPLVTIKGERPGDGGGIYYVAAIVRRAKLFEQLFPGIHEGASLVPADRINPPGVGEEERRREDLRAMSRSQQVAAALALRELGYEVTLRPTGALISDVADGSPAAGKLEPTDVVIAVDGKRVRQTSALRRLIGARRPGDPVRLSVRGATGLRQVTLRTVADPHDPSRPIIGVIVLQETQVKLPIPVKINAGSIGGPSAGLAFALDVLEELGRDVDRGYRVAATGQLEPDGSVVPIGAVKQKTIGVRRAEVDVFLVPAGDNAREARKYAEGVRIVPVKSFRQALHALATLPAKG